MEENKPKKSIGLGIIALILSSIGAILCGDILIGLFTHATRLNPTITYSTIVISAIAFLLAKIVFWLDHSDEKSASIAEYISESVLATILAIYIVVQVLI